MSSHPSSEPVSILIADDHPVVRQGLRDILSRVPGWQVVGEAGTGREAVSLVRELKPQVAVLDLQMPGQNGLETIRQVKRAHKTTEVLIFTGSEDQEMMRQVFTVGARAYILKSDASEHLVAAIGTLAQHRSYFTEKVSSVVFAKFQPTPEHPPASTSDLTPRECEIVQLLAEGLSNKEVADRLTISTKTAETHRAAVMRKLHFTSFAELVRFAIRTGLAEL